MASIFKRKKRKNGKWQISYTDENGARRTVSGAKSKAVTEQIAAKIEGDVELRRRGIIDSRAERYSAAERKPLVVKTTDDDGKERITGGHLAEFYESLRAKGTGAKHAGTCRGRAARVIEACGASRISELTPSGVRSAIGQFREDEDMALQTCNHYVRSIKQFTRWLWRNKRVREDALAHIEGYNVRLDRRHKRRVLTDEQLANLIRFAENGPVVLGMTGADRAMLYRLAVGTGFRANELRSLTPESFDLGGDPPTVTVEAAYSKHRRQDVQPIRQDLADVLAPWLDDKADGQRVFAVPEKTANMLKRDLAAAGIPYEDGAKQVFDFHALRGQYITALVKSGATPKVAQELARHSDPQLTFNTYTHLSVPDKTAALEALPPMQTDLPEREAARATGTYDVTPNTPEKRAAPCTPYAQRADAPTGDFVQQHATSNGADQAETGERLSRENTGKACVSGGQSGTTPKRTRTSDLRFRKPMLYPAELWARVTTMPLYPRYGAKSRTLAGGKAADAQAALWPPSTVENDLAPALGREKLLGRLLTPARGSGWARGVLRPISPSPTEGPRATWALPPGSGGRRLCGPGRLRPSDERICVWTPGLDSFCWSRGRCRPSSDAVATSRKPT